MRLATCLLVLAGLASGATAAPPKIGYVIKDRSAFWITFENALNQEADKLGATVVVKAPPTSTAPAIQLKLFSELLAENCNPIVLSPEGIDEFKAPIAAARARGIKIVIMDSPFPDGFADATIGMDQDAIAAAGANLFVPLVHDGDEVSVLRSNSVDTLSFREKVMRDLLREKCPNAVVHSDAFAGHEPGDEMKQAAVLLSKHPNVKAVFTPYTGTSLGMLWALKQQGLAGKIEQVGFGTSIPAVVGDAIESGAMQGWIVQQPKAMAQKSLELAIAILNGKNVAPRTLIGAIAVTKENLHDPAVQALTSN